MDRFVQLNNTQNDGQDIDEHLSQGGRYSGGVALPKEQNEMLTDNYVRRVSRSPAVVRSTGKGVGWGGVGPRRRRPTRGVAPAYSSPRPSPPSRSSSPAGLLRCGGERFPA